jgi:hypothetical protein
LAGISTTLLLQDVADFANRHGLSDALPLLRKGALVARDPTNYEEIGGTEALDDSEVDALRDEVLHKWKQRKPLAPSEFYRNYKANWLDSACALHNNYYSMFKFSSLC